MVVVAMVVVALDVEQKANGGEREGGNSVARAPKRVLNAGSRSRGGL